MCQQSKDYKIPEIEDIEDFEEHQRLVANWAIEREYKEAFARTKQEVK